VNQVDVATKLDVSERTVREVLMQLISEGLLRREPFTEVKVAELSAKEIEEILQMRILLEGWAFELAALEISQEELDQMRGLLPRIDSMMSAPAFRSLYRSFHQIAFTACRKKYLTEMVTRLFDRMLPYLLAVCPNEDRATEIGTHRRYLERLVSALESGSGKKARQIAVEHFCKMIETSKDG